MIKKAIFLISLTLSTITTAFAEGLWSLSKDLGESNRSLLNNKNNYSGFEDTYAAELYDRNQHIFEKIVDLKFAIDLKKKYSMKKYYKRLFD